MKKLLLALALILAPSLAFGQCAGVFPAHTVCGNTSASPNVPSAVTFGGTIIGPGTSVVGQFAIWGDTAGSVLADYDLLGGTQIWTGSNTFNGTIAGSAFGSPPSIGATVPAAGKFTTLQATGNLTTNVTGSTQCLTADSSGVVSGTGQVCGNFSNTLNSQTANYSIQTTDCGKTVQAGTGSTGFFTVTLPSVAGFSTTCVIAVTNGDTGRGKQLSGFPGDLYCTLYPKQTAVVGIVNGAWVTLTNPGRYRPTGTVAFNVDVSSGVDSCASDGLGTTSQAFATPTYAYSVYSQHLDGGQSSTDLVTATIQNATVTLTSGWTFYGRPAPGYYATAATIPFLITGAGPNSTAVTSSTGGVILFETQGNAEIQIDQVNLSSTGAKGSCAAVVSGKINLSYPGTNPVVSAPGSIWLGACAGSTIDAAGGNSSWGIVGPHTILNSMANANFAIVESGATGVDSGAMTISGCTATVSNGVFVADITSRIDLSGFSFSGAAACITGPKGNASSNAVVFTNGAGCTTGLPGAGAFATGSGGLCF